MFHGLLDCVDEAAHPLNLLQQCLFVPFQSLEKIEAGLVQDGLDLLQWGLRCQLLPFAHQLF
jgi:hypothetical protein